MGLRLLMGVASMVVVSGVAGCNGSCDSDRADEIKKTIMDDWETDHSKFGGTAAAPCALPANAADVIGSSRVQTYAKLCAEYKDATEGC